MSFQKHDTEDKAWWVEEGANQEERFVIQCREKFGIDAVINPVKKDDKFSPDIIVNGKLSDLKTQTTPFFTSKNYKCDPRFTVTFNRKDYVRYKSKYPFLSIVFHVVWDVTSWKHMSVEYLEGVYRADFSLLQYLIESESVPEHHYQKRVNDTNGNAKSSFLFDVRNFECLYFKE